ncbi:MAG: beta-ketoacyl synthase N-terminal-like domain-containing protein [Verrucomicrobiota bacterium]
MTSIVANLMVTAASMVTDADVSTARLGQRFGRLDLASQLALLAVEKLGGDFATLSRVGICLAARIGSLSTDLDFWNGRDAVGGPSPTLFAYTLPSAAIGEIAIRYKLTGPNLCFVGASTVALTEAGDMLERGEADVCVCVSVNVVSPAAATLLGVVPAAQACALMLARVAVGSCRRLESDRDMESVCAIHCGHNSRN